MSSVLTFARFFTFLLSLDFWPFISQHLAQLDVNHFQNLEDITTDSGRGMVEKMPE